MKNKLKVMSGFPIGIMMLVVSYVLVFVINGNEIYSEQIESLKNVSVMLTQVLTAGLYYTIFAGLMNSLKQILNDIKDIRVTNIVRLMINVVLVATAGFFIDRYAFKGEYIVDILLSLPVIFLIIAGTIYFATNKLNVNKINNSLKERNK